MATGRERMERDQAWAVKGGIGTKYKPVAGDEAYGNYGEGGTGSSQPRGGDEHSTWRKASAPAAIFVIASLIALSQMQQAFETRYEYHYEVKNVKEDGEGETYSFNLWKGVQELQEGGAPVLAAFVLIWSGIFPYVKLLLIFIVDYKGRNKKEPMSRSWGVLSVLAKWSFLDIWIVAVTVLVVRISKLQAEARCPYNIAMSFLFSPGCTLLNYVCLNSTTDINSRNTLHAMFFVTRELHLKIWTQAVALKGCFYFATALVLSQFLGHLVIHRALNSSHLRFIEADSALFAPAPLKALMRRSEGGKGSAVISVFSVLGLAGLLLGVSLPFLHQEYHFKLKIDVSLLLGPPVNMICACCSSSFFFRSKC